MRTPIRAILCPILAAFALELASAQQSTLTLSQAVDLAVKNNVQTLIAKERIAEARGERGVGFSALLPNISGTA